MDYLKHNRNWFLTGLETLMMGISFAVTNNFLDRPPHAPEIVTEINKPIYAMILIFVGLFTIVACNSEMTRKMRNLITFMLTFIWAFYSIIFLIHDSFAPVFVPHLDTILVLSVTLRITFESMWGDSR